MALKSDFSRRLIIWLARCYRADRSRAGLRDVYASKVMHRRMTRKEEKLLNGVIDSEHLPPQYAEKLTSYSTLYKRERELLYGALLVCGVSDAGVHRAPLILYNARLSGEEALGQFEIEKVGARLNPVALDLLGADAQLEERMREILRSGELCEQKVADIRVLLEGLAADVKVDSLLKWPYLEASKTVEAAGKEYEISVLSATCLASVERSQSSRGVLAELDSLVEATNLGYSSALGNLLGLSVRGEEQQRNVTTPLMSLVTLSQAQEKILHSARQSPITLCHGPPGTGKSFTLAAVAIDHLARGESVLVSARNDHAVDVLGEKIDEMFGDSDATLRAGKRGYLSKLKKHFSFLLRSSLTPTAEDQQKLANASRSLKKRLKLIDGAERELEREIENSIKRGAESQQTGRSILKYLRQRWSRYAVSKRPLLAQMFIDLELLHREREFEVQKFIDLQRRQQQQLLLSEPTSRRQMKTMLDGLKKLRGSEQEEVFSKVDFAVVLKALPIWLTKTEDVHRVLPMKKELFDVVIIDEASQCDLASMLPLIQRAKRVVIAGDDQQLRHISFVSTSLMEHAARELKLADSVVERYHYRRSSLMDLANEHAELAEQTGFLDEHFRSKPAIISFSNEQFYQGQLKLMRDTPWAEPQQLEGLHGHYCRGIRDNKGVNTGEIDAIVASLEEILTQAQFDKAEDCLSIGVLSPLRDQVDALWVAIRNHFEGNLLSRLLNSHKLALGTAHGFQGAERDIMLLSFCVDASVQRNVLRFVERQDVFNVAITRAKQEQHIFYSCKASDLPSDSLLGCYLSSIPQQLEKSSASKGEIGDAFAKEVVAAMQSFGATCLFDCQLAGIGVDIVATRADFSIGIDLLGYPGRWSDAVSMRSARVLARANFTLLPLGYLEWKFRREECLELLRTKLLGGPPIGGGPEEE